ncbi:MAG: hypothetical protein ABSE47_13315 [Acidimicrobiales bacterium]|jgi:hypothetical protein
MQFSTALAHGVADFEAEDLAHGALTLTFGLSAWMRRTSVGIEEAWAGVLLVRDALLEVGGLDRRTEPVPLRASDPRTALISATVYLDGLLARAAHALGDERRSVAAAAVAHIGFSGG